MNQRFYSLDVFRGATVALMILVNNPGSWGHIYAPLEHAAWHGSTPTDLVFPFFLFAVGNAMAFVIPKLEAKGESAFWKKVIKRTLLIFLIGFLLSWFPFIKWNGDEIVGKPWSYFFTDASNNEIPAGVRIMGVLQRIAICYFFASTIIHFFKVKGAFIVSAVLLLGYWWLCIAGNPADPYSLQGWFGSSVDESILGKHHIYRQELLNGVKVPFDPEGLISSLAAIVQVIFGYFVGDYILKKGKNYEMLSNLFVAGAAMVFAGYCWDMVFPINKKIWTSSYTLYTTGLATILLCVMMYWIEFKKSTERKVINFNAVFWILTIVAVLCLAVIIKLFYSTPFVSIVLGTAAVAFIFIMIFSNNWSRFFDVFGKNPLFIFVLSGVLPRLLSLIRIPNGVKNDKIIYTNPFGWFYENLCKPVSDNLKNGSLLYAICFIIMMWAIAWWMDKKKIYVKV